MKKIDKLVISKFIGPFVLTFFITLFIIVMQFLWKYIDDLVGKGLEWHLIGELIFFASASFVPLALPLAVLLSSIMTMGNFGQNYELVAVKSSGISLLRFMAPMTAFVVTISAGAFFFSNNILPHANLRFATLLWDIRHQKPALNIKEGVFYDDIEGFSIRVGNKEEDNKTIHDVMIYDHSNGMGNDNVIVAKHGEMYTSDDERFLIIKLKQGKQYSEVHSKGKDKNYEHLRTYFDEWVKQFDLTQFEMDRTDERFWKNHYQMLNVRQLRHAIDTFDIQITDRKKTFGVTMSQYFSFKRAPMDSVLTSLSAEVPVATNSLFECLSNEEKLKYVKRSLSVSRSVKSFAGVAVRDIGYREKNKMRHELAWHKKFTFSVACVVLFFIGAPLGAIIRIGGLGMPMLWSIVFFVIFHVFTMTGTNVAEEMATTAFWGSWAATLVLLPMGIFLSYKAMRDSALFDVSWYYGFFNKLIRKSDNSEY